MIRNEQPRCFIAVSLSHLYGADEFLEFLSQQSLQVENSLLLPRTILNQK